MSEPYSIRRLETIEEFRACVELQEETWGLGFSERVPPAILKVSQMLGGVSAGAFNRLGRLVGFVFGMTGPRDGEVVHWSDMLAVRPEARDTGLGSRLKAYQREQVLGLGVDKMFWTFDPLQSRNAYVNLSKLGAVVREYERDMYGDTDSPLHRGIGTDRLVALWQLSTNRVIESLARTLAAEGAADDAGAGEAHSGESADGRSVQGSADRDRWPALVASSSQPFPRPSEPSLTLDSAEVTVAVPADIGTIMKEDPKLALEWWEATRAVFVEYLGRGYQATGFEVGPMASSYVLTELKA